jgi:hypothetical protein
MSDTVSAVAPLARPTAIAWTQRSMRVTCCAQRHRIVLLPSGHVSTPDHGPEHTALAAIGEHSERCEALAQEVVRGAAFAWGNLFPVQASGRLKAAISEVCVQNAMLLLERVRFCGLGFPTKPTSVWSSHAKRPAVREIVSKIPAAVVFWDRKQPTKGGAGTVVRSSGYSKVNGFAAPKVAFAEEPASLRLSKLVEAAAREQSAKLRCAAACVGWSQVDEWTKVVVYGVSDAFGMVRLCQRRGGFAVENPSEAASRVLQELPSSGSGTGGFGLDVEAAVWGVVRAVERFGGVYLADTLDAKTKRILTLRGVSRTHVLETPVFGRKERR